MTITDGDIDATMQRAIVRLRADRARSQRVMEMPAQAAEARLTLTRDGWVEVGVMVDPDWQHDWQVWLHLETGQGRLRPWNR